MKKLFLCTILCFLFSKSFSQDSLLAAKSNRTHYYTEVGTFLTTSSTMPFWLRSNQYGIVPNKGPVITTFRGGIYHDYDKLKQKKYDWGYGADVAINAGFENKIYLPEAYVKVKLNKFEFYAGRRREVFGLVDTTLTSGSYSWSGNALPIPKIQISIPDYLPIGFTNGFFAFKGSFAHGWFDNKGVVKDFYLHQKTFYARLGKDNWKVKMYAGFVHNVQWGGTPSIKLDSFLVSKNGKYPSTLKDYWYAVTGKSLNNISAAEQANYPGNDAYNRVGNHVGSVDLGVEIYLEKFNLFLYRQNLYETGTLFRLTNIQDGLQGISFKNKMHQKRRFYMREVLCEYLYTANQGGRTPTGINYIYIPSHLQGEINYFNNGQYFNGWAYRSQIIGTPFITQNSNFIPQINQIIDNSRVSVLHLGLIGNLNHIPFEARFSYSNNYGTYSSPIKKGQFSSNIKVEWKLAKVKSFLVTQLATDFGDLYDKNLGFYVGIKRKI